VVQQAFAELEAKLRPRLAAADDDPRHRLFAVCDGYLDFAQEHPECYRTMFGGLWMPALEATVSTEADLMALGDACLALLREVLDACVTAGYSTSTAPSADTVALWPGLHGLAHQRAVTVAFPWLPDIAQRMIIALAHLNDAQQNGLPHGPDAS
jgi:AcrR family transcriptional regulator